MPDPSSAVPGAPSRYAWVGFAVAAGVWGSTFLVIAFGNDTTPPLWGCAIRLVLASVILFAVMGVRRIPRPAGDGFRSAAVFGFFLFGLNMPLIYLAEMSVPSGLAAVIFATAPLSQSLLTRAVGLERMTPAKVIGAIVALLGVALIFWHQITVHVPPLGMLWLVLATWAACVGSVVLKRGPRQSAIASNAVGTAVGAAFCLLGSVLLGETRAIPHTAAAWFPILYLAVLGSVVAFVAYSWLLNQWDATRASYTGVVVPVVAVALGALVRHERIGWLSLAGALVVIVGVVIGLQLWRPRRA
jgi:drug/metabolite transporter (DMT)-like permease